MRYFGKRHKLKSLHFGLLTAGLTLDPRHLRQIMTEATVCFTALVAKRLKERKKKRTLALSAITVSHRVCLWRRQQWWAAITKTTSAWHHSFTRLLFLIASFPIASSVITHLSSWWRERRRIFRKFKMGRKMYNPVSVKVGMLQCKCDSYAKTESAVILESHELGFYLQRNIVTVSCV